MITFNSSLGWQALERGLPVYSDPNHSIVGSYYKLIDNNNVIVQSNPEPLFEHMMKHQFSLRQIEQGEAWGLVQGYLST